MEHNIDIDDIRRKADALLKDLLDRSTARPSQDIARNITSLAFEDGNPVRDLFLNAVPIAPSAPTSSPHSLKSKASKPFLRFRREHKTPASDSKAPAAIQQIAGSSSGHPHNDERQITASSASRPAGRQSNEAGTGLYKCIICDEDMSSKGVCKRHLEEQHVLPKTFKCERCGDTFTTKGDAKKHCNRCGLGVFTYSTVKPPAKRIYASEFTEEWFSSKQSYLEHLLRLSKKDAPRLRSSLHCKLRALLSHPNLLQHADNECKSLFGSATAWRSMRWSDEQLQAAILQIEDAAILQENGTVEFGRVSPSTQKPFDIRAFLRELLCNSTLSVSTSSQPLPLDATTTTPAVPDRHSSIATTTSLQTISPMTETDASPQPSMHPVQLEQLSMSPGLVSGEVMAEAGPVLQEIKAKRHLSDDSRLYEPDREPPGPSSAPVHFHNPFSAGQQSLHELPMVDSSVPTLPYRSTDDHISLHSVAQESMSHIPFHPPLALAENMPSAAASSTTLVSNYQEPKFIESTTIPYIWNPQQNIGYITNFNQQSAESIPYLNFQYPSQVSLDTASINTEHTSANTNDNGPKMQAFLPLTSYQPGTFGPLPLNSDEQDQFQDMNPHPG